MVAPAKWRRKSGVQSGGGPSREENQVPIKVEIVEENLIWDLKLAPDNVSVMHVPPEMARSKVRKGPDPPKEVISLDAELGEENMELSSTRSNSPVPAITSLSDSKGKEKKRDALKELNNFMSSLTAIFRDSPESVRKKNISKFMTASSSFIKPAVQTVEEPPPHIDLTDLIEPPPLTTNSLCTPSEIILPSPSDNIAYLSLLDSDDESPTKPIITLAPSQPVVKQEYSEAVFECSSWIPPRIPNPVPTSAISVALSEAGTSATHAKRRKHGHGLPSPPISDPTPEREDRERSRSVSVALMSIIPATLKGNFAVEPVIIKEEELPPIHLGLATPPPSVIKPLRSKNVRIPLPSPPLSRSDIASPISGRIMSPSPSHRTKAGGLKRKAPSETALTIKIPSLATRAERIEELKQRGPKGKKRRRIKSVAWVLDDSPEPEPSARSNMVAGVPISANGTSISTSTPLPPKPQPTIKVEQEAGLEVSKALPKPSVKRGRPPKKKKQPEEAKVESAGLSLSKKRRTRKIKPITPVYVPSESLPTIPELSNPSDSHVHPVKQEQIDNTMSLDLQIPVENTSTSMDTSSLNGLRRSQRIPKPRIKKEIEDFVTVPLPPTRPLVRKPRPSKLKIDGKSNANHTRGAQVAPLCSGTLPSSTLSDVTMASKKRRGRRPKIKAEPIDSSVPTGKEKLFIRIPAAKLRQIAENPPIYEID